MTSFTRVFGGSNIAPSQVSYTELSLDANITLVWPLEAQVDEPVAATVIDVVTSGTYTITMPDARRVGNGTTILFNNLGPDTITIADALGAGVLSATAGTVHQLYLADNSSEQGQWRTFQYGAATAQAQAALLAGPGIASLGSTLAQITDVSVITSDPYTVTTDQRAEALVWEGALGTFDLPSTSVAGAGWFLLVRNGGTGDLTLDPASSETINGETTLRLSPGDSAILVTDGTSWWTIGLGQSAIFAFDYNAVSLAGLGTAMSTTDYVLTGSELNRTVYKFTGAINGDMEVVVPATIQQYWIDNSTTGGSYTVSIKAAGSATTIGVPRGQRGIYYCNGTEVIKADTTSGVPVPLTIAEGGTSATSATNARTNLGAAAAGANADITSLSALTTPLSVAQGGTGGTSTPIAGGVSYGDGTKHAFTAAGTAGQVLVSNGASAPSWTTLAGIGTVTSINVSGGSTGLTASGGPITVSGTITLGGTLAIGYGGTGANTAIGARANILPALAGKASQVLTVKADTSDVEWAPASGGSGVSSFAGGTTGLTPATATTGAVTLGGTLAVASGGTGSATAAGARATLGAAASGANTDITSLTGLGDGSAAAPAMAFASATTTGPYRPGANRIAYSVGGSKVLDLSNSGSGAIILGATAMASTGNYNVAIGYDAGTSYTSTTASYNVFVGYQAGFSAVSSQQNVFVGRAAGSSSTGNSNTCVGYNAASTLTSGSNVTCIGNGAEPSSGSVTNQVVLGNSSVSTFRCQVALTVVSDGRDKRGVTPLLPGLDLVLRLKPVSFLWAARDGGRVGEPDIGFIAQDLLAVQQDTGLELPGLVLTDNPDKLGVTYEKLIPVLVKAIQQLAAKVDALERLRG